MSSEAFKSNFNVARLQALAQLRKRQETGWINGKPIDLQTALNSQFWQIPDMTYENELKNLDPVDVDEIGTIRNSASPVKSTSSSSVQSIQHEKLNSSHDSSEEIAPLLTKIQMQSDEEDSEFSFTSESSDHTQYYEVHKEISANGQLIVPYSSKTSAVMAIDKDMPPQRYTLRNQRITLGPHDTFYITEIASPIHFWFHFEEDCCEFQKKLNEVYTKFKPKEMLIDFDMIQPGLIVACLARSYNAWHRAKIVSAPNDEGNTRVFYVDFGTVSELHHSDIKFLLREFAVIPQFGNRGRLPGLMPFDSITWSPPKIAKFIAKFANVKMSGNVLRYDATEKFYELDLCLTDRHGETTNVKNWLIKEEIAIELEQPGPDDILPLCYHMPKFEWLENHFPALTQFDRNGNVQELSLELAIRTNCLANNVSNELKENSKLEMILSQEGLEDVKGYYSNLQ